MAKRFNSDESYYQRAAREFKKRQGTTWNTPQSAPTISRYVKLNLD